MAKKRPKAAGRPSGEKTPPDRTNIIVLESDDRFVWSQGAKASAPLVPPITPGSKSQGSPR